LAMDHAGMLCLGSLASMVINTAFGVIELSGEVELRSLTGAYALPAARLTPALPAASSCPPTSTALVVSVEEEPEHVCRSCATGHCIPRLAI
jgi:hypothetical protein